MKYTQQIFDRLSRGRFYSSDSVNSNDRNIYNDLGDNKEQYAEYFSRIGFTLEEGEGYYYFSRKETKYSLADKLKKLGHWIDILDFFKAWEPSSGPGREFSISELAGRIDSDIELREKAKVLYDNKVRNIEICQKLTEELLAHGFIELVDDAVELYQITSAFRYLEDIVKLIEINEEDEIPE